MTFEDALTVISKNFVQPEFQSRFVHEAQKKPAKLMARISHQLTGVFAARFKSGTCRYKSDQHCFMFGISGRVTEMLWQEAMIHIENHGKGGYLLIDEKGESFYAQSEGFPPDQIYAGNI